MFGDADGVAAMAGDVSTLAALVAVVDAAVVRRRGTRCCCYLSSALDTFTWASCGHSKRKMSERRQAELGLARVCWLRLVKRFVI